ncbi:AAA family ATPase [Cellulosimicrobium sp. Marseille-Q4280]|uniref:AAA family ATPase n=1 Tax=Cellulosimicrobium sp. Marseille-Q4280 TaxID=2937992 RepID=UPI0020404517|nr:AAA family ATPase [Cellulosimicrobium sp. Marseille-Q4280]
MIVGAPGTGKSTLGRALARQLGAALVDRDTFYAPLAAVALEQTGHDPADLDSDVGKALSAAAYQAGEDLAGEIVSAGCPVVLVAPYSGRARPGWRDRLDRLDAQVHVVWLDGPFRLLHDRITERGAARDAATLASWDRFVALAQMGPPVGAHVRVDAALETDEALAAILRAMNGRPDLPVP